MWTILNSSGRRIAPILNSPSECDRYIENILGGSKYAKIWEIK